MLHTQGKQFEGSHVPLKLLSLKMHIHQSDMPEVCLAGERSKALAQSKPFSFLRDEIQNDGNASVISVAQV